MFPVFGSSVSDGIRPQISQIFKQFIFVYLCQSAKSVDRFSSFPKGGRALFSNV
jgi:hypothetical protein